MYRLVTLAKPRYPSLKFSTAFIYNPEESLVIKGGNETVHHYLQDYKYKFWGKIKSFCPIRHTNYYYLCSNVANIQIKYIRGHRYFEFYTLKHDLFIMRIRNLPEKWLTQLERYHTEEFMVAADYLDDKGFTFAAQLLRKKSEDEGDKISVNAITYNRDRPRYNHENPNS